MSFGLKKILNDILHAILKKCPGGELRRCRNISPKNSDCILHFDHYGRCEDAWRYKWKKEDSL
jgi:hypothetical protein|tara:strand:+ start:3299 stop:3487 length:189 start_codon:yes stop_codon:yes gene_type:complete